MELNKGHYHQISDCFPRQRGNVSMDNLSVLNAFLYVAENGCKWRSLPPTYGKWHTVYTRMNRWAKSGVLDRVFTALQQRQIVTVKIKVFSMDSTSVKVHPDGTGALKKTVHSLSEFPVEVVIPKFIWLPQVIGLQ
jgi:transposase